MHSKSRIQTNDYGDTFERSSIDYDPKNDVQEDEPTNAEVGIVLLGFVTAVALVVLVVVIATKGTQ